MNSHPLNISIGSAYGILIQCVSFARIAIHTDLRMAFIEFAARGGNEISSKMAANYRNLRVFSCSMRFCIVAQVYHYSRADYRRQSRVFLRQSGVTRAIETARETRYAEKSADVRADTAANKTPSSTNRTHVYSTVSTGKIYNPTD